MDVTKKIEELEEKIKSLESQNRSLMFGRSYSQTGSTNSDYLIKTRGQIKIQIGNKYIDLIKDGKFNFDAKLLFSVKTFSDIGIKEGIYFVEEDGSVWIKFNGDPIQVVGDENNSYVSYNSIQSTTPQQKHTALLNLGIICNSILDLTDNSLQNGFVYVEDEQQIYIISDGQLTKLQSEFPNPLKVQLIIDQKGKATSSLKLIGSGLKNGIEFGESARLYESSGITIDHLSKIRFSIASRTILDASPNSFRILVPTIGNEFKSSNYTENTGFRLYYQNNQAILHLDKVIERYPDDNPYTFYIFYKREQIKGIQEYVIDGYENMDEELRDQWSNVYEIAANPILFTPTDKVVLVSLVDEINLKFEGTVVELPDNKPPFKPSFEEGSILVKFDQVPKDIEGGTLYLLERTDKIELPPEQEEEEPIIKEIKHDAIILDENSLYISNSVSDYSKAKFLIGDLQNINLTIKETVIEEDQPVEKELPVEESGLYSKQAIFSTAAYKSDYFLDEKDCSSRLASTEWVIKYLEQNSFQAGYYWSESITNNKPDAPIFIGTDIGDFQVTPEKPYLWSTTDGKEWVLRNKYIYPDSEKIYVCSTLQTTYRNSATGEETRYPAGFFCYIKDGQTIPAGFGESNYIPSPGTVSSELVVEPKLELILSPAEAGKIPYLDGYLYLWSINSTDNKILYNNWTREYSFGISNTVNNLFTGLDFGNHSLRPGFKVFEVDENNFITGTPSEEVFITDYGKEENWNKPVWIKSFLMSILRDFLAGNQQQYNPVLGWAFNYNGIINCFGFGGYWSGRIGAQKEPNEDYDYSRATFDYLSGNVTGYGYTITFDFNKVLLGKRVYNLMESYNNAQIGDLSRNSLPFYDVDYQDCSINIIKLQKIQK